MSVTVAEQVAHIRPQVIVNVRPAGRQAVTVRCRFVGFDEGGEVAVFVPIDAGPPVKRLQASSTGWVVS